MSGVRVLTSIFLLAASSGRYVPGVDAVNRIRIGPNTSASPDGGNEIRIGDDAMNIKGPARIIVCNAKGAHTNTSATPQTSATVIPRPEGLPGGDLGEGLGAIFGLMEGFAKVAEGLEDNLNNPDAAQPDPENPIGGLFALMGGLAKVAEGLDKGLNAPPDECAAKAKPKCTRKGGKCSSSSECNGKVIPNACEGDCTCCAPPPCNKATGFFKVRGSDQCFKAYTEEKVFFDEAETICKNDGLVLAEPKPNIAPKLQKYLKNTYGGMFSSYWLSGRGTGDSINWQRSGDEVAASNSRLWWPDEPAEGEHSTDHCLYMTVWDHALEAHPGRPYLSGGCSWKPHTPLCERIDYV